MVSKNVFYNVCRVSLIVLQGSFTLVVEVNMSLLCLFSFIGSLLNKGSFFKIAVIIFKALHGSAPDYITELIKPYTPSRSLRSSNKLLLFKPRFNLLTYGGRSFTMAAPSVWNSLPLELSSCCSRSPFKSKLKTLLFKASYDVVL